MATFVGTRDIALESLTPHPGNPNRGEPEEIAKSLEAFGQFRGIVANQDGTILAGHHVYQAAKRLGWKTIRVDVVEADEKESKKIMLADNRLADLGLGPDLDLLLDALSDLEGDYVATGYDDDYVKMLMEATAGAPTLEDLENENGPVKKEEYWRRVTLTMDPTTATRWEKHRKMFENDDDALLSLFEAQESEEEVA
jgi:hypothetical protein